MATKKKTTAKKTATKKGAVERASTLPAATTGKDTELAILSSGIDIGEDSNSGLEGADQDSYAIPIIRVLQPMSPQVNEADGEFIEGARAGMLFNTATSALLNPKEEDVHFLPCAFQRRYIRWAPRGSDGSSYRGESLPEEVNAMRKAEEIVESDGRLYFLDDEGEFVSDKKNDRCVDTRSHYGILVTEGGASPVLFPLSSTQVKKSKRLMSLLSAARIRRDGRLITPPTWLNKIRVGTVAESNDEGNWFGVKFEPNGFIEDPDLYAMGKEFHHLVTSGGVNANYAAAEEAGDDDEEGKEKQF